METEEKIVTRKEAVRDGLKWYFTGVPCSRGHIDKRLTLNYACNSCHYINSKKYKDKNQDKIRSDGRKYYHDNKEKVKKSCELRKESIKKQKKIYTKINADSIRIKKSEYKKKNRKIFNENYQRRLKEDDIFLLKERIRSLIKTSIRQNGFIKKSKSEDMLGCSIEQFKIHIEKQFSKGMTWENRSKWHLDHIVPISSAKNDKDIIELNHFSNFRPLWAIDNIRKGGKMEYLL